ncbi:hypothetical protein LRS04_16620 [Phenylobacterium sp. J367]|nr:hypothetical protein [Phenylobacterium sp. J367]MCR5879771.1 hypothetical protein [Phenylobacterium sp. J367]
MRADVDAACWLVDDQQPGFDGEPTGEHHLLLVSAGELFDRLVGVGRADIQPPDVEVGQLLLPPARQRAHPALPGLEGDGDVLADRQRAQDAVVLAVLRREADARAHRLGRAPEAPLSAGQGHLAAVSLHRAEHQERRLAAA